MRLRAHHTLILGTVGILGSMWLLESLQPSSVLRSDRAPASFSEKFHEVAQAIQSQEIPPEKIVQISEARVPERERFQFGVLKGQYQLWIDPQRNGRIWKVEALVPNPDVRDWRELLQNHADLFVGDFSKVNVDSQSRLPSDETDFLSLRGVRDETLGRALLKRTSTGAVHSLWIESSESSESAQPSHEPE